MKAIRENEKESRDKGFYEVKKCSLIDLWSWKPLRLFNKSIDHELLKGLIIFAIFISNVNIEGLW